MYTVSVSIQGVSVLLQHRYPLPLLDGVGNPGDQSTGAKDYTQEWREYFYAESNGQIYQPAVHVENALVKAAANFKIAGKRGRTYKDLFKAAIFITPDRIPHDGCFVPETLDADADKQIYIDIRPVVIQRARVVRLRPAFKEGWKLDFEIQSIDDEIQPNLLQDVLILAGKMVGIGDYRPRFGRFNVVHFEVYKN